MAKTYAEKDVEKWTVRDLTDYMSDKHLERFDCDYQPFGSWAAERGRISQWFGTARKAGKYDKKLVKEFIDHCFATYKPTSNYPGVSFGFCATYLGSEFQHVQKEYHQSEKDEEQAKEVSQSTDSLADWFNS